MWLLPQLQSIGNVIFQRESIQNPANVFIPFHAKRLTAERPFSSPALVCETEGNYGLADETNDRRARKWAEPCAIINFLAPLPLE